MKQRTLCLMAMICCVFSYSQGIRWTTGLSWEQVRQKAKQENKYIFMDVFATWCGPCKKMDRDIYPLAEVGKIYNDQFISIRVQGDHTQKDAEEIKNWYKDAQKINEQYKIKGFPTFLFFSPNGELVHRASGGFNAEKFIDLANDALHQRGYAKLIKAFKEGQYENLNLQELALSAKYAGEDSLAKEIATAFIQPLDVNELLEPDNLVFVLSFGESDKKWARKVCMPKINELSMGQLANPNIIRFLLFAAQNDSLASRATDYWVSHMTANQIFKKDTLQYLKTFVRHSKDKSFTILFKNLERAEKILGKGNNLRGVLNRIILFEEFFAPVYNPALEKIQKGASFSQFPEPDWEMLNSVIARKYGSIVAYQVEFTPKVYWYDLIENKKAYTKNLSAEMERTKGYGLDAMELNNKAWAIFKYSTIRKEIEIAIKWVKKYYEKNPKELKTDAAGIDTYAALLYKSGKIKDGIVWEEKARVIDPRNADFANTLSKMKKALPIWPEGFDLGD